MDEIRTLMNRPEFPRSSGYEDRWMLENQMGPNALWLMEWLSEALPLTSGMRVLDLGCGKGMSSIFLAREHGLRVWGTDLWIGPDKTGAAVRRPGWGTGSAPCASRPTPCPSPPASSTPWSRSTPISTSAPVISTWSYLAGFVRPVAPSAWSCPG